MANPNEHDLSRKIDQLSERITRIEAKLGIDATLAPDSAPQRTPAPEPPPIIKSTIEAARERKDEVQRELQEGRPMSPWIAPAIPEPRTPAPQQPAHATPAAPPSVPAAHAHKSRVQEAIETLRSTPTVHAAKRESQAPPSTPAPIPPYKPVDIKPRRSIELAIGMSWFAWVGAIVLLLAGALFITTAYREGWIGAISPTVRCIAVAIFGVLLLGAGEWALRKITHAAAVGFYGAGLGILYLDAFATSQWFHIAPESTAFILLSIVALVGFALTLRAKTLTIGVLSVVGGYLAPILLSDIAANPAGSAVYLTMLLTIALALSAFMPKPMRALRYVAITAHGILAIAWLADAMPNMWLVAIVAFSIWWIIIIGESLFAAMREQSAIGNVVVTLLATAWYVIIGCGIISSTPVVGFNWLGAYTFAIAALSAAIALQFGPGIEAFRQAPRSAMDKLSVALLVQAGALLIIAVALHFDGYARSIAWLAIGLAAIEIGRRLPSRGLDVFGLFSGALGVGVAVLMDSWATPTMQAVLFEIPGAHVTGGTVLILFALAAMLAAAKRLRAIEAGFFAGMKITLVAIAILGWLLLWVSQGTGVTTTWLWLAAPVALITFERFGRKEMFFELGIAALAITAGRWLIVDAVGARISPQWDAAAALPFFNWHMALAVAIAASAGLASVFARLRPAPAPQLTDSSASQSRRALAIILATIGFTVFMLLALSFEVDRMATRFSIASADHAWSLNQLRNLLLTSLWAMGTVAVHVFAHALRKRGGAAGLAAGTVSRIAWTAMILLTGKWMVIDTLLFGVLQPTSARTDLLPMLNVQMITAIIIAGGALFMLTLMKRAARSTHDDDNLAQRSPFDRSITAIVPTLAGIFILWALSFELDRFIMSLEANGTAFAWPTAQYRALAITMLWSVGCAIMASVGKWRRAAHLITSGAFITVLAGLFWLTFDTVQWRLQSPPTCTTIILNMQFVAGVVAALAIAFTARLLRPHAALHSPERAIITVAAAVIAFIALWLGSFEIDRAFVAATATLSAGQVTARQMCLSVYWGLFAFALIAWGFRSRSATVRYAGIALFGVTLIKVFLVDLSQVHSIYRVASLLAVGLLLVFTSVAYAKLAPRLLGAEAKSEHDANQSHTGSTPIVN